MNYKMTHYYRDKLKEGKKYENFIKEFFFKNYDLKLDIFETKEEQIEYGETKQGYEIKCDAKFCHTGNLYIEISEKSNENNENYIPSGIYRKDNTKRWIIGNYKEFYIFEKSRLLELHYHILNNKDYCIEVETATSKGFLIPTELANKLCIKHEITND